MRKAVIFFLLMPLFSRMTMAEEDLFLIRQNGFVKLFPVYQSWDLSQDNDFSFSELSVPVSAFLPVGNRFGLSMQAARAAVNSSVMENINGFSDVQLGLNYYLEQLYTVFNVGLNVPSGKSELSYKQFQTSLLLSLNQFDLRVPNFGQGLNVSAGLSWAYPLSDVFVVGLGAAYQLRGEFKPVDILVDPYDPGDEIVVTTGFEARLSPLSSLAADVVYTTFEEDKMAGEVLFASGNKIAVDLSYRHYIGAHDLWLSGTYRSKDKNRIAIAGQLYEQNEKTIPDHGEVAARYRYRIDPQWSVGVLLEGRFFQQLSHAPGIDIYGIGFVPEYRLNARIDFPVMLKYLSGRYDDGTDFTGWEAGAGLLFSF